MSGSLRRWSIGAGIVVLAAGASGCTFKSVKPELSLAPPQAYKTAVLGDVKVEDKLAEGLVPHFRRGFLQRLSERKVFETVVDGAPAEPGPSALILSGTIVEVNKGSAAMRALIGFGAGRARVRGAFEIKDSAGVTLARFSSRQSYAGGVGIGGIGLLDMEDLMKRFGETIAENTVKWAKGEKLE